MQLTDGRLRIELEPATGAIRRLVDTATGAVHFDLSDPSAPACPLFRLMVPSPQWPGRHCDADAAGPPRIERSGKTTRLIYPELIADGRPAGITATVTIEPSPRGDELLFSITVDNRSSLPIIETQFPRVGGWHGLGGPGRDRLILGANADVDPHGYPRSVGRTYARCHQRGAVPYPVQAYLPWLDLSGPGGGMSMVNYMRRPVMGTVAWENLAGYGSGLCLSTMWAFVDLVEPGTSWSSPPVGLAVHGDDWHATADRYADWIGQWFTPAPVAPALRQTLGVQNVWVRAFDETPIRPFEDLPAAARVGREHGIDHLCVWDSRMLGTYMTPAQFDLFEYTSDEKDRLTRAVLQARSEGSTVSALVNLRLIDPSLPVYTQNDYRRDVIRLYDGSPKVECWAGSLFHATADCFTKQLGPNCHIFSPFSARYRDRVMKQLEDYLSLGFDALFFDQPFEAQPDYGRTVDDHRPEDTYAAVLDLISQVRNRLLTEHPEAYIIGEQCEQFGSRAVDWWMAWYPDIAQPIRAHYALPHTLNSHVIDSSVPDAVHAFAAGLKLFVCVHGIEGTLADEPALAAKVRQLAALRKRTAARTSLARFRDNRGISVHGDNHAVAFSYDGPQGPAVIVASPGGAANVSVDLDRTAFDHAGSPEGTLLGLDGSERSVRGDRIEVNLAPDDVIVWQA